MKPTDHTNALEDDWKRVRPRLTGGRGHARVLTDKVFGYLRVIERATPGCDKHGASLWNCRCELCGKTKVVTRPALTSGRVKSCGCLKAGVSEEPRKDVPKDPRTRGKKIWDRLMNED